LHRIIPALLTRTGEPSIARAGCLVTPSRQIYILPNAHITYV
jgi:hypothetical protein